MVLGSDEMALPPAVNGSDSTPASIDASPRGDRIQFRLAVVAESAKHSELDAPTLRSLVRLTARRDTDERSNPQWAKLAAGLIRRLSVMTLSIVLLAGIALGITLGGRSQGASAAITPSFTMSMTIPSIAGDGTSSSSTDIAVRAYSFGLSKAVDASGTTSGKAKFSTFTITKTVDTASPLLFQACASGTNLGTVKVHINLPGAEADSAVVTMSSTRVSAVSNAGAPGGGADESVDFTFQKITIDYVSSTTLKKTHFGWDLATNSKV